jgi:hypothetical protein
MLTMLMSGKSLRTKVHGRQAVQRPGEHGAVIILVVLVLLALAGAAALGIDVGVLYTAQAQAQNAADSGALACAGHMLVVNKLNQGAVDKLRKQGRDFANLNNVLTSAVNITMDDVTLDLDAQRCRVCVPRTAARGNPVPTFFAKAWNRQSVDIMACATAEVANARTSNCIKPWALPDAFDDGNGNGAYDAGEYYEQGVTSYGTDYRNNGLDVGLPLTIKQADPNDAIAAGQFFPIDLPLEGLPDVGGDKYRYNIVTCNPIPVGIGDTLVTENGNMIGPTQQGVDQLINMDPNAFWDDAIGEIANSAYGSASSPRIIRIVFFNPADPPISGKTTVVVTNIASLFLESIAPGGVVTARVMRTSGTEPTELPSALQYVRLVE